MAKINELREKRAKIWEQAKAFLDSHRNETGILSAEDTAAYEKMEKDIVDLGHEIDRQQRADELERELNLFQAHPLFQNPITPIVRVKQAQLLKSTTRHSGIR